MLSKTKNKNPSSVLPAPSRTWKLNNLENSRSPDFKNKPVSGDWKFCHLLLDCRMEGTALFYATDTFYSDILKRNCKSPKPADSIRSDPKGGCYIHYPLRNPGTPSSRVEGS